MVVDAFERDGDPISVTRERMKRRVYQYGALTLLQGGLYAGSQVMYEIGEFYEGKYRHRRLSHRFGPGQMKAAKWNARAGRAYMAGKTMGKLASRGVPVVGTALIVYDVYTIADWMFAKGKLPHGARDRS